MKHILTELLALKANPINVRAGICGWALSSATLDQQEEFKLLMCDWPEFSGDEKYPVPHPIWEPEYAYNFSSYKEFYDPDEEYGAARLRLLDYLIEEITKIVEPDK